MVAAYHGVSFWAEKYFDDLISWEPMRLVEEVT